MSALPKFIDPLPDVPVFLKTKHQWVLWKLEEVNGKLTKVPYQVNGKKASSTNPDTWTDYQTAVTCATINSEGGIGFVVNDDVIGIDIDGCRDPKTGEIAEWADAVIEALGSYTEVTPSGTGVRVLVSGALPEGSRHVFDIDPTVGYGDKVKFEVYSRARYFTVSGKGVFQEADLEPCELTALYQMLKAASDKHPVKPADPTKVAAADMGEGTPIVYAPGTNFKTDKYSILLHGVVNRDNGFTVSNGLGALTYPSQSEADLSFATVLALVHDGDTDKMDADFRKSPLYREKWERDDYRERTFRMALETAEKIKAKGQPQTFEQPAPAPQEPSAQQAADQASEASKDATGDFPYGDNEIPAFDDSAITGIYRRIVDAACNGTTIPRQYAFLAARVYIGALIAGKITFDGMEDSSSYYGMPIGLTGTGKGLAWKRVVDNILAIGSTLHPQVKILEGSGDSGAGLKDFFFDDPMDAPVVCMIDEITSLGHKAGEKKNPEIVDTMVELATKYKFTRAKAARGKAKAGRSHHNAHLSIYMCAQDKYVIAGAFPNRGVVGFFERLYGEYSAPVEAGRLPKVDSKVAVEIWDAVQKLPKSGHMTMAAGVEDRVESYWAGLPNDVRTRVRLKAHLYRDMYIAAHGRGVMVAEMVDLDAALANFPRQIKIREAFFTLEVPDKIGLYQSRLKTLTEGMRRRLNAGEPVWQVAMSLRDFQTDTNAFRANELHIFQTAWRAWESQVRKITVEKTNGHKYDKFIPEPYENEEGMWT